MKLLKLVLWGAFTGLAVLAALVAFGSATPPVGAYHYVVPVPEVQQRLNEGWTVRHQSSSIENGKLVVIVVLASPKPPSTR
jgi:hypothetical protein